MGYQHIDNLYKAPEIFQCYAPGKIHGTSAHLSYRKGQLRLSSGGEDHARFAALFDRDELRARLAARFTDADAVAIYGEAFGGTQQGMAATYGEALRFLAFDVRHNGTWLDVPAAEGLCRSLGLGFVPYERGPLTLEWLDAQRDRDSLVAVGPGHIREGVVVRAIRELADPAGGRFLFKHKRDEFRETASPRPVVDPGRLAVLAEADAIAREWATPMRLSHVLQKVPYRSARDTPGVLRAMQEDIRREAGAEVVWSRDAERSIAAATAALLRERFAPPPGRPRGPLKRPGPGNDGRDGQRPGRASTSRRVASRSFRPGLRRWACGAASRGCRASRTGGP